MRVKIFYFLLICCVFAGFNSCKDDTGANRNTIYGSWVRDITDTQGLTFTAEITFNTNNTYDFKILTTAPGHSDGTGNFINTAADSQLSIVNDAQCGVDGRYDYVIGESSIALIAKTDDCPQRVTALQGVWKKK